jgi:hypothetical protein
MFKKKKRKEEGGKVYEDSVAGSLVVALVMM